MTRNLTANQPIVGIVGPCGSGKSTLCKNLREFGINAHEIAQEHSFVPDLWSRFEHPGFLVFVDASFKVINSRKHFSWSLSEYQDEQLRLLDAYEHADIYILTDNLTPRSILRKVLSSLNQCNGIKSNTHPI